MVVTANAGYGIAGSFDDEMVNMSEARQHCAGTLSALCSGQFSSPTLRMLND